MDFSGIIFLGGILTYVGIMVYLANQVDAARGLPGLAASTGMSRERGPAERWLRWLQLGLAVMIFLMGFAVLQASFLGGLAEEMPEVALPQVNAAWGMATFVLSAVAAVAVYQIVANETLRQFLQARINRWGGRYNAHSAVHNVALVLMLAVTVYVIAALVLEGGVSGLAESMQENGLEISDAVFQAVLEVVIALLGVGFAIRRDVPQTLRRLGLRVPTLHDIGWGVGMGIVFWLALLVVEVVWVSLVSPEVLQEQTAAAEQMTGAFSTLPLAFALSLSAAVGEEIWLRGALQPVFGIVLTSVFFTVLHIQVAFTPAMLVIFALSLGLGWLRRRGSTVTAIIAHFVFNFVQLGLASLLVESV